MGLSEKIENMIEELVAIAMHGHDGRRARGYGRFYLLGIHSAGFFLNVYKHGRTAIPPDAVGGGHETIWRRNDFSFYTKCLKCYQKRHSAIRKQTDVWHLQILSKGLFQLLMELPHVCHPFYRPNLFEHLMKLVEVGQQR